MKKRYIASIVVASIVALSTSGCTLFFPQSTQNQYDPTDGVGGIVGVIDIRNAVLISNNGHTANLIVSLVNTGAETQSVEIQYKTGSDRITTNFYVAAGQRLDLGGQGQPLLILENANTTPGGLFPIFFQYGNQTGTEILVPVLTSALPEYSTSAPSDVIPTSVPTSTPTILG